MKKFLYLINLVLIMQTTYTLSMATDAEVRVKIAELQEATPTCKTFFEHAIAQFLQDIYSQNGCASLFEMKKYHGYDELDRLLNAAYKKALESYQTTIIQKQAEQAAQYYNW
jgi:hypothetical protein